MLMLIDVDLKLTEGSVLTNWHCAIKENIMQVLFGIAYFVIGLVQLFAIVDGIDYAWGVGGFLSFIIAMFVTYIPFVGAGFGVYGAVNAWDWELLQAVVLFFWFVPVFILIFVFEALSKNR